MKTENGWGLNSDAIVVLNKNIAAQTHAVRGDKDLLLLG